MRASRAWAFVIVLQALAACTPSTRGGPKPPPSKPLAELVEAPPVAAKPVDDAAFAEALFAVLRQGAPNQDRQATLAGVIRRQLIHSAERLPTQREQGIASVYGALYLLRLGELQKGWLDDSTDQALSAAQEVVSARGDEGRASAFFSLRKAFLPEGSQAKKDLEDHIAALEAWQRTVSEKPGSAGPTEMAGRAQRRLTAKALLEPTTTSVDTAADSIVRWIEAALAVQQRFRLEGRRISPDEVREALRAVGGGGATMAALYLRYGDALSAYEALSTTSARKVTPDVLLDRVRNAAEMNDASSWAALADLLMRHSDKISHEDAVDTDILQAALFGVSVEAFRKDPSSLAAAQPLAASLVALGMPEALPFVLTEAAQKNQDPVVLSPLLGAVARTILRLEEDDPVTALRVFKASNTLLTVVDTPALKGRLSPSPSRLRLLGAALTSRMGDVTGAKALLTSIIAADPSVDGLRLLAEIARFEGDRKTAISRIEEALTQPELKQERPREIELRLMLSDVIRENGDRDRARTELITALKTAVAIRQTTPPGAATARLERALARVLERLGEEAAANRASSRALASSQGDEAQISASILEALMRTFVDRDLVGARKAARRASEQSLKADDAIYAALWLQFLEKELKVRSDGTAAALLMTVPQNARWSGRLSAWAHGRLPDKDLISAAKTASQKVEATFYIAMAKRANGENVDATLKEVAAAPTFDLLEVQLARDILAGSSHRLTGSLAGISIP